MHWTHNVPSQPPKAAFPAWSRTRREERIAALERMHRAMAAREEELLEANFVETAGAPAVRGRWMATYPMDVIAQAIDALKAFDFEEQVGIAKVILDARGRYGSDHALEQQCRLHLQQAGHRAGGRLHHRHQAQ